MNNPLPLSTTQAHRPTKCCLAHVRAVLGRMRNHHPLVGGEQSELLVPAGVAACDECDAPTSHDQYAAELENALVALPLQISAVRYDDVREIARARVVFAASLALPLLIIAAVLVISGGLADRATLSLLHFAELALATPLVLAASFSKPIGRSDRTNRFPLHIAIGVAATFAYVAGLSLWSLSDFSVAAPIGFALTGFMALGARVREWMRASRPAING